VLPSLGGRLWSLRELVADRIRPDSAMQWLGAALDGLAVLGLGPQPIANPNPTEVSEVEALRLVHHLRVPGAAAAWARRLTPYLVAGADPQTCSRQPWSHVKMGTRQDRWRGTPRAAGREADRG
jgi:hypothetical protein